MSPHPDAAGNITIHNIGEGAGALQSPESPVAPEINNIWIGQSPHIADDNP
jgi:hypothetical protein